MRSCPNEGGKEKREGGMDRRREGEREGRREGGKVGSGGDSDFLGHCADATLRPVSGAASDCHGCQDEASMDGLKGGWEKRDRKATS